MTRSLSFFAIAIAGIVTVTQPATSQSTDTICVGSVKFAPMPVGTDTFDMDMEIRAASGVQHQQNVSIHRTTKELRGKDSVFHAHFGAKDARSYWDVYVDAKTLATVRYEQHTDVDSLIVSRSGDCFTGWVDMEKVARRTVACDRYTDRFAGTPMDELLIPLLPLRAGMNASLATYGAVFGKPADYAFNVVGQDTLSIRGKTYRAWRIEHRVVTDYGAFVTTLWVDRDRPRTLKFVRTFGNGRKVVSLLRNP